jgi:hypothetical protein
VSKATINLKKSSLQRVFEFVLKALRKQGKPSMTESMSSCVYRGPNGERCAAGIVMPDDMAEANNHAAIGAVPGAKEFFGKKYDLVRDLQLNMHDLAAFAMRDKGADFLDQLEFHAAKVAKKHGLIYKAPGTTLRA